jgi:hypothetical protein
MQSLEEKLTTKWYREYSHKLHMQRLQEIKSHASKRIDNSTPKTKEKLSTQKQGKEFLQKEKKKSITKHNQQLLKILTEINKGKRETVTQKILNSAREVPAVKSLNISVRKKEARRIDEDNEALVRRLNEKPAELSAKKFQDEWEVASRYRESISKKGNRFGTSHLASRLPPMESHERMGTEKEEDGLSKTLGSINLPSIQKKIKKKNHETLAQVIQKNRRRSEDVGSSKIQNEIGFDLKDLGKKNERDSPKEVGIKNKETLEDLSKEVKKSKDLSESEKTKENVGNVQGNEKIQEKGIEIVHVEQKGSEIVHEEQKKEKEEKITENKNIEIEKEENIKDIKIQEKLEEKDVHSEDKIETAIKNNSHKDSIHENKEIPDHLEKNHEEKELKNEEKDLIHESQEIPNHLNNNHGEKDLKDEEKSHKKEKKDDLNSEKHSQENSKNLNLPDSPENQEKTTKNDSFHSEKTENIEKPLKTSENSNPNPPPLKTETNKEESKEPDHPSEKPVISPEIPSQNNLKTKETSETKPLEAKPSDLPEHSEKLSDLKISELPEHSDPEEKKSDDEKNAENQEILEESFEKFEVKPSEDVSQQLFEKLEEEKEVVIVDPEVET